MRLLVQLKFLEVLTICKVADVQGAYNLTYYYFFP